MRSKAVVAVSGRRRARRSESQWRALVSAFAASGASRQVFCTRNGVAVSTFDWWRKRLGGTSSTGTVRANADTLFVELSAPVSRVAEGGGGASAWDVELDLGAGVVLRVRRSAPSC